MEICNLHFPFLRIPFIIKINEILIGNRQSMTYNKLPPFSRKNLFGEHILVNKAMSNSPPNRYNIYSRFFNYMRLNTI